MPQSGLGKMLIPKGDPFHSPHRMTAPCDAEKATPKHLDKDIKDCVAGTLLSEQLVPLSVVHLYQLFWCYVGGMLLATFVFALEVCQKFVT